MSQGEVTVMLLCDHAVGITVTITVTSWKYYFPLFVHMIQWYHRTIIVMSQGEVTVMLLCGHTVGSHCGITVTSWTYYFPLFNHMFQWYHRTIIVMSQGEVTVVLLCGHAVESHCGITVTPWTYYFSLFYSYVSVISQNFHSDVTGWDHCDAAVWPSCRVTVTSWKYYFALFIYIFQWYHRSSIVCHKVRSLWCCCVVMLWITRWDHCEIMDILFCIIYSYVSVISQNYHSDVTRWRYCDAAVWSRTG